MSDKTNRNWFARHKVLTVILGLLVVIVIATATGGGGKKSNADTTAKTEQKAGAQAPAPKKETITLAKATFQDQGYGVGEVIGEATNNDTVKHSATLKATFYDTAGKLLGTASGVVNDIEAGQTKTYNLMTTDKVAGYANIKVEVDTLL